MINKDKNTIGGIPRNCFKSLQSVGLKPSANRVSLIRECSIFGSLRIEVFKCVRQNSMQSFFLLFVDDEEKYITFTSFRSLLDYIELNFDL